MKKERIDYLPSPKEIKEACLKLREKWSEDEFFKRANVKKKSPYTVPTCDLSQSYSEFQTEKNIYRFE